MSINELIQICADRQLDGKETDTCCRAVAVNVLVPDKPVCTFTVDATHKLLHMMKAADSAHIYVDGGVCHFNALYSVTDRFPAARIYFIKSPYLDEIAKIGVFLEEHGIKLPIVRSSEFEKMIDAQGYPVRYKAWLESWQARSSRFKGLVDGRVKNTVVEKGIWLSTDGCLICGSDQSYLSTATLVDGSGVIIGMRLCGEHVDEASEHKTLINFVAEKMGVPAPFLSDMRLIRDPDSLREMSHSALKQELHCEIEKVQGNTITAIRPSGFRVILRQDAVDNYAYVVQDPNRKEVSRIDSADHHDVDYGPAHLHRDLSKSKKNQVEPSFTYGLAMMDVKGIRALLERAEANWKSS